MINKDMFLYLNFENVDEILQGKYPFYYGVLDKSI
jgi:hypothetical protein